MHPNTALIQTFYEAFQKGDAETMASCYHPDVVFNDPAFRNLRGKEAGDMWRMLISRAKGNLEISFSDITADATSGSAKWEAVYPFGPKKRKVHNRIQASFRFQDGKIIEHRDQFPFWKWASMALGPIGSLLGWSPFLKSKVRAQSAKLLSQFRNK
ncbi:MAG: nuclear transport factor 2 family protein [Saprospiraceae bacterium]|nr:nuclear transport factor 2 family protein [Saprospiraceae bacterium]